MSAVQFKGRLGFTVVLAGLLAMLGCVHIQPLGKTAEELECEKDLDVRTIGEITDVANAGPLVVSGVGLVTGLNGTGHSPAGEFRSMLENELRKQKIENVKQLLDSADNALVLLSGLIRAGSRKADVFDIEITLPPGSKATSLAGGYLQTALLRDYDTKKNINPDTKGGNGLLPGHVLAHGSGPILVGLSSNLNLSKDGQADATSEATDTRRGRIWSGGISHIDRPFFLVMNNDQKFAKVSNAVAQRINLMFEEDAKKRDNLMKTRRLLVLDEMTDKLNSQFSAPTPGGRGAMARALNKEVVQCNVPYTYRFNPERYLRVARLVPLQESPEQMGRYRKRLDKMLNDPAETVRASLRLEALGKDCVPVFKQALKNEHPLVRFCAAESLAYLGSTAGCETLSRLAEEHPPLRYWGLLAMGSLEEGVSRQRLAEMLDCPDAEVRCGAFQSLRQMDETDKNLHAEAVGQAFWLHTVAPTSRPLVYFSVRSRAEIVVFGKDVRLVPPVKVLAGPEFTVTAEPTDDRCTISRFLTHQGSVVRRQCSLQLDDVLRTLAELGGQYPDAVDFLSKVGDRNCLNCPVTFTAMPEAVPVETLAQGGKDPEFLKNF